ncbi:MAG: bifunctional proline dehydrogenase/L-glutamate gamma-semialdehyde dehydrogenase PutA [Sphingomonadales bacterium]
MPTAHRAPLPTSLKNDLNALRTAVRAATRTDEAALVNEMLTQAPLSKNDRACAVDRAATLVEASRAMRHKRGTLDVFLQEFGLSNQEGVALMCLAEALLRIPNPDIADELIAEKINSGRWAEHKGRSESTFVNAGTWALMLTGRLISLDQDITADAAGWVKKMAHRTGEPVIRRAMLTAMRIMGGQFVMGRTIGEALARAARDARRHESYSFDMLGEGARTYRDAASYFAAYETAIENIGKAAEGESVYERPGISVKISALHPRYEFAQADRLLGELMPRLTALARQAAQYNIGFTIDVEEADRLDLLLEILETLAFDDSLTGWNGLGVAVQAYQKRAPAEIDWLIALARKTGRRLMVRLVKGAYWDSEIKHAQELGLSDYPVFTRKSSTDLAYIVCAGKLAAARDAVYPQFATHNAHTIAAVLELAGDARDFEFQRLHGMGELLYRALADSQDQPHRVRVYAPVGAHEDLLPYLVRRLLENGVNSSFVNRFMDAEVPVADLVADPIDLVERSEHRRHASIPVPPELYGEDRKNALGIDLSHPIGVRDLIARIDAASDQPWTAAPIVGGKEMSGETKPVFNPAHADQTVGTIIDSAPDQVELAVTSALAAQPAWDQLGATGRAGILRRMGDALEADTPRLMAMLIKEAGKTIPDALAEVREAVDFCRYFATQTEQYFAAPLRMPGPTGETNDLYLLGRGIFLCISPWNFPLAIFTGQIAAALTAGNAVLAKPAEPTPLIAAQAVRLFHQAGVPGDVLHLLPGRGSVVGAKLVADERIAGVTITGSTETARAINRTLAARQGAIVPLVAETGGQNAMIVDSTALPEQVVDDVVRSAFGSAGQRCSALRVLFVEEDVADKLIDMLIGATEALVVGDPANLSTDIGPVIDQPSRAILEAHAERMMREARLIEEYRIDTSCADGAFFAPRIFEIENLSALTREVFGPILHVIRYQSSKLDDVLAQIRATGYGLTLGVHSRIEGRARYIFDQLGAGNTYVNRNMIGAVVGVQPFGGEGLSGTGPKTGGPRYLFRFAKERTLTINTTATGGNAQLFCLDEG